MSLQPTAEQALAADAIAAAVAAQAGPLAYFKPAMFWGKGSFALMWGFPNGQTTIISVSQQEGGGCSNQFSIAGPDCEASRAGAAAAVANLLKGYAASATEPGVPT